MLDNFLWKELLLRLTLIIDNHFRSSSRIDYWFHILRIDNDCFDEIEDQRAQTKSKDNQSISQATMIGHPLHC